MEFLAIILGSPEGHFLAIFRLSLSMRRLSPRFAAMWICVRVLASRGADGAKIQYTAACD